MKPRRFYLDLELGVTRAPIAGHVLIGPNVAYLIVDAYPTESRIWDNRWTIVCRSIGDRPRSSDEWASFREQFDSWPSTEWHFEPYQRGQGPNEHFRRVAAIS